MSYTYIDLPEGETVVIRSVPRASSELPPPAEAPKPEVLDVLLVIPPVTIYAVPDGSYVHFMSDLDVCNDGSGPEHGDQHHQPMTAYYNGGEYLNADKDKYMVVPPQIRSMVGPIVMGCQAKVTNMQTGVVSDAVVGDIGPKNKTGECSYCLAKELNPSIGYNSGDTERKYLYECWPGKAAVVDGKHYKLEAA